VSADLLTTELHPRQTSLIYVTLDLDPGLHIYGPDAEDYVPTSVSVSGPEGLSFGEARWPERAAFELEGEAFDGYEGRVEVAVPVTSTIREEGAAEIQVRVGYQACNDNTCFLPRNETLTLEVTTAPSVRSVEP